LLPSRSMFFWSDEDRSSIIQPIPQPTLIKMTNLGKTSHHSERALEIHALSRSMEGAKAFLKPHLLEVPWLWRVDGEYPHLVTGPSDELNNYGKLVRSLLAVASHSLNSLTV